MFVDTHLLCAPLAVPHRTPLSAAAVDTPLQRAITKCLLLEKTRVVQSRYWRQPLFPSSQPSDSRRFHDEKKRAVNFATRAKVEKAFLRESESRWRAVLEGRYAWKGTKLLRLTCRLSQLSRRRYFLTDIKLDFADATSFLS